MEREREGGENERSAVRGQCHGGYRWVLCFRLKGWREKGGREVGREKGKGVGSKLEGVEGVRVGLGGGGEEGKNWKGVIG